MGFSVLMSVYAREKSGYLKEALESIISQTLPPDEIVLIEDGPLTVELEGVIEDYKRKYPYLHTFRFEKNVQLGRALAKGVELCANELIARMDTDDIAVLDRFEQQYTYMMEHSEIAVCGGWMEEFNDSGTYLKVKRMPEHGADLYCYAKYRNPLNHMTVMFRKSAVIDAGNYCHFPYLEDYHLWSRILVKQGQICNVPKVLVRMRNNDNVYERRGGISYCGQYLRLRNLQKRIGLLNTREWIVASVITLQMTLSPTFVRKFVYRKILRK